MVKAASVPFAGTKEQEAQLLQVIAKHKESEGALIPILHEAQGIYGYLPIEVQKIISEQIHVPLAEIYGVVTFYTQFSLNPKGKYQIGVCMGTACYVKGAGDIIDKIKQRLGIEVEECTQDGKFSITATRCIGACGLAPVLTVNDDVYGRLILDEIDSIIDKYE